MRVLAVLFNLIAVSGVGQVAIGRWRRGVPWIAVTLLAPLFAFVHLALMFAVVFGVRIGSAVEVALLERRSAPSSMRGLAVFGGGLVAGILWSALLQTHVIEAFKIPSGAMIPTLQIGDHLFVNKLAYRFGEPARGDVAVFVNPCEPDKDFIKRIVGLAGDTIEVRCDVLYVNGVAAPSSSLKESCSYWDRFEADGPWQEEHCITYLEELDGHRHEMVHGPDRRDLDRLRAVANGERTYEELAGEGDFPELPGLRMPGCREGAEGTSAAGRIEETRPDPKHPTGACRPQQHYVVPAGNVFVMGDNRENSSDSRRWGPVPLDHLKGKAFTIWWSSQRDQIAWDRLGALD